MATGWGNLHGDSDWCLVPDAFFKDDGSSNLYADKQPGAATSGAAYIALSSTVPDGRNGVSWSPTIDQGQGLCFAPNGVGKGASVIIPALLGYGGSMFVLDPKGENAWVTAQRRRDLGHNVAILDPFGEVNRLYGKGQTVETLTKFNPLRELDPANSDFADDIARICEAIIIKGAHDNPHWPDSYREYLGGIIALSKEAFGIEANFRIVRRLITGDPAVLKDLFDEVAAANPESLGVTKLRRFFKEDTEELKNVRSGTETQTSCLDSGGMQDHLDDSDEKMLFSFRALLGSNTTVYVVIPPDRLVTHSRWLRLLTTLALKTITRQTEPPRLPIYFLCDEMGTIGYLEPLETGFALFRGYGIRFFGFLQTISQLKRDYPKGWENFIGNCSYLQCLGARDDETAKFISDALGTTTWQSRDKTRQERRALMLPDEVKTQLGNDLQNPKMSKQVIIRLEGNQKYLHYQNPYWQNPFWNNRYRQIPWKSGPLPEMYELPPAPTGKVTVGGTAGRPIVTVKAGAAASAADGNTMWGLPAGLLRNIAASICGLALLFWLLLHRGLYPWAFIAAAAGWIAWKASAIQKM